MGYILLAVSAFLFAIAGLQWRAGVVFRPFAPLYRDAEPPEFWAAVAGLMFIATVLALFGLGLVVPIVAFSIK